MFNTKFTFALMFTLVILSGQVLAGTINIEEVFPVDGSTTSSPWIQAYVYFSDNYDSYTFTINGQPAQMDFYTSDDGRYFLRYENQGNLIAGNNTQINVSLTARDTEGDSETLDWSYIYSNNGIGPVININHDNTTLRQQSAIQIDATTNIPAACEYAVMDLNSQTLSNPTFLPLTAEFYSFKLHSGSTDITIYSLDVAENANAVYNATIQITCDDFTGFTSNLNLSYLFNFTIDNGEEVNQTETNNSGTNQTNSTSGNGGSTGGSSGSGSSSGSSSGRRGGGGGGGSSRSTTNTTPTWTCALWSECSDGKQTRNCRAGTLTKTETQNCKMPVVNVIEPKTPVVPVVTESNKTTEVKSESLETPQVSTNTTVIKEVANQNGNAITGAAIGLVRNDKGVTPLGLILMGIIGMAAIASGIYYDYKRKQEQKKKIQW